MRQLILFLFFISLTNAQTKKEYFFDENSKHISKGEFMRKIDHRYNLGILIENDTASINKLVTRKNINILSPEKMKIIRDHISEISATNMDINKTIVINYYSGLDEPYYNEGKSQWNIYRKSYLKNLHKADNIAQYWIYKYKDYLWHHHADRVNWLFDKNAIIENTFFPYHFNSGSFVIILSSGEYYSYYGEYGSDEVMIGVKEMKQKYAN